MRMKQAEEKITALYERLSRDDDNAGDRCVCVCFCRRLEESRKQPDVFGSCPLIPMKLKPHSAKGSGMTLI